MALLFKTERFGCSANVFDPHSREDKANESH